MAKTRRPAAPAEDDLTGLLQRIDRWLKKHRAHFYQALAPGATEEELQALPGKFLPEELRTWLTWHNGQGDEIVGSFVESWNLMSVAQILEAKEMLDAEAAPTPGWKTTWIPLLDDGADDYVCLCPDKGTVPVREVWQGHKRHAVVAASLTEWARDFATALEAGAFVEDPERGGLHRQA